MSGAAQRIMAHMIPFYPDLETSRRVADALIDGGAACLEIQFAYSDPTADGPAIQAACAAALDSGFRVAAGWDFVRELTAREDAVPVFLMSYAGLVYSYGIDRFVETAAAAGVTGLIVPDLPLDADEGLLAAGRRAGVAVVPVIALGAHEERMRLVLESRSEYIYAALRRGITGTHTEVGEENAAFVERLASGGAHVMAGFGISSPEQVAAVLEHAGTAVVGSAFVRSIAAAAEDPYPAVRELAARLSGRAAGVSAD